MKLIGLIGGVSPEATPIYYAHLNAAARAALGGEHSARVLIYTLDYGVMIEHYHHGDWPAFIEEVVKGAKALKAGGAEALVICSNTTHVGADAAAAETGLPLMHIMDALVDAMKAKDVRRPVLLGTPVVMSPGYYRDELGRRFSGELLIPSEEEKATIGRVILDELVNGVVRDESRVALLEIVERHAAAGADGVILGCTELCMILEDGQGSIPIFDTTAIHAQAAARFQQADG